MFLFQNDEIFERKVPGYFKVVQRDSHRVPLSFGAVSEGGREGRLPPFSLGSPEA